MFGPDFAVLQLQEGVVTFNRGGGKRREGGGELASFPRSTGKKVGNTRVVG